MTFPNTAAAMSNSGNPAESTLPVVQVSAKQQRGGVQSLEVYCKPIEYYNLLHERALEKPLYLQRCLRYKVQEKHKRRQRSGNVTFNFKCYNGVCQASEVMKDYSCAICLIKCASFKGLKCHLRACHDLFHYEFQLDEDHQVVNVSFKTDEFVPLTFESFGHLSIEEKTFSYCKPVRSRRSASQLTVASDMPATLGSDPRGTNAPGNKLAPKSNLAPCKILLVEPPHPTNRTLLQKRQFYHSRGCQRMTLEEVLAKEDSDDEADDDVADLEERRRLDDLVDLTEDQKYFMYLWNLFVRKQRVVADAHIPWACEAFVTKHGKDFIRTPKLTCYWRLFMCMLWKLGLIDAKKFTDCNQILENIRKSG